MKSFKYIMAGVAVTAAMALAMPAQAVLTDGLKAYWEFDGNAVDSIGGLNPTNFGGTSFHTVSESGLTGNYVQVNSGSTQAGFGSSGGLTAWDFGTTDEFTISAWVRADNIGNTAVREPLHMVGTFGWWANDGLINKGMDVKTNSVDLTYDIDFDTGTTWWRHFVQTLKSDGTVAMWIGQGGRPNHPTSPIAGDADHGSADFLFTIAGYTGFNDSAFFVDAWQLAYIEGKPSGSSQEAYDEIAVWNRALSDAEIETVFDLGKAGQSIVPIPEPASLAMLLVGGGLMIGRRRRTA